MLSFARAAKSNFIKNYLPDKFQFNIHQQTSGRLGKARSEVILTIQLIFSYAKRRNKKQTFLVTARPISDIIFRKTCSKSTKKTKNSFVCAIL
jgi:hypothetical protein